MVFEEGLDISCLPKTLKDDFAQLDRLEGQYRVTNFHMRLAVLEDLSPRKSSPHGFCNVEEKEQKIKKILEVCKPTTTLSKVIF